MVWPSKVYLIKWPVCVCIYIYIYIYIYFIFYFLGVARHAHRGVHFTGQVPNGSDHPFTLWVGSLECTCVQLFCRLKCTWQRKQSNFLMLFSWDVPVIMQHGVRQQILIWKWSCIEIPLYLELNHTGIYKHAIFKKKVNFFPIFEWSPLRHNATKTAKVTIYF